VTTHFHSDQRGTANDIWQSWYYFAHGSRGMIGWVEGWFDGNRPRAWLADYRPRSGTGRDSGAQDGRGQWLHDGVALYYSHPSIQVSWCLDIEPHGKTWVNRGNDARLGTSAQRPQGMGAHPDRRGIQYSFLAMTRSYARESPRKPGPDPALVLCSFQHRGPADRGILPGRRHGGRRLWLRPCSISNGKGRSPRALDGLFGCAARRKRVASASEISLRESSWVETDQDKAYSYHRYRDLFTTLACRLEGGFAVASVDCR